MAKAKKSDSVEETDTKKTVEVVEEKKVSGSADDFFSAGEAKIGINDFIKDMKEKREEIEPPPSFDDDEIKPDADGFIEDETLKGESDSEILEHFNFTKDHKINAEFLLVQLDKVFAFSASLISHQEGDRYRRRKEKMSGKDYESDLLAAILKKYQMRLSLEWMFVSALAISYAPMYNKAIQDKKAAKKQNIQPQPIK